MIFFVKNSNGSLRFCLTVLKFVGFLIPHEPIGYNKIYFRCYWFFWFMFLVGFMNITQMGDMFQIWGNVALMTSAAFLLFTNIALSIKILNVVTRSRQIQAIINESEQELMLEDRAEGIGIVKNCAQFHFYDLEETLQRDGEYLFRCNRGTTSCLIIYIWLSAMTVFGWACGAEKNQLPLRAWFPYDTSRSPAYELTYAMQSSALIISALVNVCLDTLATSLIAVCRCRLRLVRLSLRNICEGITIDEKHLITLKDEGTIYACLQKAVLKHEAALKAASRIQECFNRPILAQFTISTIIICVTAYQLAMELSKGNWVRIVAMVAYLLCMMLQVFFYCYQGNQLTEESSEISGAAYECPWYACTVRVRRALLIVMVRSRRVATLTAGGFTTLSLGCFMSIIKASYTFFTVLQQV